MAGERKLIIHQGSARPDKEQGPGNEAIMKSVSTVLLLIIVMAASRAGAAANYVFTGSDIDESCRHAVAALDRAAIYDDHRFGVCAGFIAGIVDFHTVATTVESLPVDMFCLPPDITTAQVIREVAQYLAVNREKHHDLAAYLVILALRETYPCQQAESGQ